tara:strand:- start:75 stop:524 length:450 start_codon:yes stop_codon:yes gene_type:complete
MNPEFINNNKKIISNEYKKFINFLAKFNVVGLAIGTIIALSLNKTTNVFSENILMPIIKTIFKIENIKLFYIKLFGVELNIGLLLKEGISLLLVLIIMFVLYNFVNIHAHKLIENSNDILGETELNIEKKILNELKLLNKKNKQIKIIK